MFSEWTLKTSRSTELFLANPVNESRKFLNIFVRIGASAAAEHCRRPPYGNKIKFSIILITHCYLKMIALFVVNEINML